MTTPQRFICRKALVLQAAWQSSYSCRLKKATIWVVVHLFTLSVHI